MERVRTRLADDPTLPVKDFQPNLDKYKDLQNIVSIIMFYIIRKRLETNKIVPLLVHDFYFIRLDDLDY